MAVLSALRWTPGALRRNPDVFVPVLVVLLFQLPQLVLQAVHPLLASVVSLLISLVFMFITPFFQAGIIGMADEALDGETSLDTFVDAGTSNYVSVLAVYLLLVGINFVLGFVAVFAAIFGGVAFFSGDGGSLGTVALVGVGIVVLVVVLAYLLLVFFTQFYGQAIVIDDNGALDGLKHSVRVVRRHLVSTLGYTALVVVGGGLAGLGLGVLSAMSSPQSTAVAALPQPSLAVTLVLAVVVAAAGTLLGGFMGVFSVAFYRRVND